MYKKCIVIKNVITKIDSLYLNVTLSFKSKSNIFIKISENILILE